MTRSALVVSLAVLACGVVSCSASDIGGSSALDTAVAARLALDSVPELSGRLAVVRRAWKRYDTVLVQLAGVSSPLVGPSASESTLVVWISPDRHVVRRQWVLEARQPLPPLGSSLR